MVHLDVVFADIYIVRHRLPARSASGESNMEYGGAVMLMVCVVALFWGGFSIRKTESTFKAEMKRKAETKTLAELMSINMGGA